MLNIPLIPTLESYEDWLKKAKKEFEDYKRTYSVYDLANCLLSLNALPEWIREDHHAPSELKTLSQEKIKIMKHHQLNIEKLKEFEIDNCLRLTRLFCNHAKHSKAKDSFVKISTAISLPANYPLTFKELVVGNNNDTIEADKLLKKIIDFWDENI
jgi:hypothetical protein